MEQPDLVPGATQARKTCWTCSTVIQYQKGFCESCWNGLDPTVQDILGLATLVPDDSFSGFINEAVVLYVHSKKVRAFTPRPKPAKEKREKLPLSDLTIRI